jgi:hypothetical protein
MDNTEKSEQKENQSEEKLFIDRFNKFENQISNTLVTLQEQVDNLSNQSNKKTQSNNENNSDHKNFLTNPLEINNQLEQHAQKQETKISELTNQLDKFKQEIATNNFLASIPHTNSQLLKFAIQQEIKFDKDQNIVEPEKLLETLQKKYPELIRKPEKKDPASEKTKKASQDASAGKNSSGTKKYTKENISNLSLQEYLTNRDAVLEVLKN